MGDNLQKEYGGLRLLGQDRITPDLEGCLDRALRHSSELHPDRLRGFRGSKPHPPRGVRYPGSSRAACDLLPHEVIGLSSESRVRASLARGATHPF